MKAKRVRYGTKESPAPEPTAQPGESSVYARGQTVIPKHIREALSIEYGTRLHWEVREGALHVIPIPQNPVQALRGILKGTGVTYAAFMEERQRERRLEQEQERQWEQDHRPAKARRGRGLS